MEWDSKRRGVTESSSNSMRNQAVYIEIVIFRQVVSIKDNFGPDELITSALFVSVGDSELYSNFVPEHNLLEPNPPLTETA